MMPYKKGDLVASTPDFVRFRRWAEPAADSHDLKLNRYAMIESVGQQSALIVFLEDKKSIRVDGHMAAAMKQHFLNLETLKVLRRGFRRWRLP